jgi:hypothetical protein
MDLSFLKNVEVIEVAAKAKAARVTLEKTPVDGADLRVYKNGRIFPHPKTAEKFSLEFGPKEEVVVDEETTKLITVGNGLDIFNSNDWQMISTPEPLLFVAIVPREGNAKIDVYASTTYEEDGTNKRSVFNNTISTFGADVLLEELTAVYGVDWETVDYVDLAINTEFQIKAPRDVYSIPKVVSRGEKKGEAVYVTRKNIEVYPLTLFVAKTNQVDLEDSIAEVEAENAAQAEEEERTPETPEVVETAPTNKKEKAE